MQLIDSLSVPERAILLLSGGIDSTTLLWALVKANCRVTAVIVNYGQSLGKEIRIAQVNARAAGAEDIVNPTIMMPHTPGCSIIDLQTQIQMGRTIDEIAAETPTSYVPFRNGVFFAWATALAEARGITHIYGGCNGLLSGNYWDDTTQFAAAMEKAADAGTHPQYKPQILAPLATVLKKDMVKWGLANDVDYTKTWSCYHNGEKHCGKCDSCAHRREAFTLNGLDINGARL